MRAKESLPPVPDTNPDRIGLVLLNQVAATISQDHGRDARDLAERSALPVLALERPGSTGPVFSRRLARMLSTPDGYTRAIAPLGQRVNQWAEERGHERIVIVARSVGALGGLALAASGTVSRLAAIFAAEPVGFDGMTLAEGTARHRQYGEHQARRQAAAAKDPMSTLVLPEKPGLGRAASWARKASIAATYPYDQYHNGAIVLSDAGLGYARHIARDMPGVDTTIEFAADSLSVRDPSHLAEQAISIAGLRDLDGALFSMRQIGRNTTHASYDRRSFMFERLLPTLVRLASSPPSEFAEG